LINKTLGTSNFFILIHTGQNGASWFVFLITDTLFYSYVYDE
jgi:hypothetical protein